MRAFDILRTEQNKHGPVWKEETLWHGPWVWEEVSHRLADRGFNVSVVELATTGAEPATLGGRTEIGTDEGKLYLGQGVLCPHGFGAPSPVGSQTSPPSRSALPRQIRTAAPARRHLHGGGVLADNCDPSVTPREHSGTRRTLTVLER